VEQKEIRGFEQFSEFVRECKLPANLHWKKLDMSLPLVKKICQNFAPAEHAAKLRSSLQVVYWFNFMEESELQCFVNDVIAYKRKNPKMKFQDCCWELGAII